MKETQGLILSLAMVISCSHSKSQTDIEMSGIADSYHYSDSLRWTVKNNADRRFYFHLEGDSYSKENLWREFENNLLMQKQSKTETNFWLGPKSTYGMTLAAGKFLEKFSAIPMPDSFRVRVVYYTMEEKKRMDFTARSFVIIR